MPRRKKVDEGRSLQVFLSGVNSRSFTLRIPSAVDTLAELCQFITEEVPVFVPKKGRSGECCMINDGDRTKCVYRFLYSVSGEPLWCVADCLDLGQIVVSVNPGFIPPDPSLLKTTGRDASGRKISTPIAQLPKSVVFPTLVRSSVAPFDDLAQNMERSPSEGRPPLVTTTARHSPPVPHFDSEFHHRSLSPFPIPPPPYPSATRILPKPIREGIAPSVEHRSLPEGTAAMNKAVADTSIESKIVGDRGISTKNEEARAREMNEEKNKSPTTTAFEGRHSGFIPTLRISRVTYEWNLGSCELFLIRKWKSFQMVRQYHITSEAGQGSFPSSSCLLGVAEVRHVVHRLLQERAIATVGASEWEATPERPSALSSPSPSSASRLPPLRIVISGPRGSGGSTLGAMVLHEFLHSSIPCSSRNPAGMELHHAKKGVKEDHRMKVEVDAPTALQGYLVVLLDLHFLVQQAVEELSGGGVSSYSFDTKGKSESYDPIDDVAANLLFWCEAVLYAVADSAVASRRPRRDGEAGRQELRSYRELSAAAIADFWMSMLYPMSSSSQPTELRGEVVESVGEAVVRDWEKFAQFAGVLFQEAFSACTAANLSGMSSLGCSNLDNTSCVKSKSNDEGGTSDMNEVLSLRDEALQLIFRDLAVEIARSLGFSGIFFVIDGIEILLRGTPASPSRPLGDLSAVLQGLCDRQRTAHIHVLLITTSHSSMERSPLSVSYIPGLSTWIQTIGFLDRYSPTVTELLPKHIHCFDEVFPLDIFRGAPGYLTFLQQLCLRDPETGKLHVPSCVQLNFSTVQKALRQLQTSQFIVS